MQLQVVGSILKIDKDNGISVVIFLSRIFTEQLQTAAWQVFWFELCG